MQFAPVYVAQTVHISVFFFDLDGDIMMPWNSCPFHFVVNAGVVNKSIFNASQRPNAIYSVGKSYSPWK